MEKGRLIDSNGLGVVYDWMTVYGGSERMVSEILRIYPQSELHALLHHAPVFKDTPLAGRRVATSFMQRLPDVHHYYRALLPLMPLAIENMDVSRHKVVLSISHAVAHAVPTDENQIHVAYICTPMRYVWHLREDYLRLHQLNRLPYKLFASIVLDQVRGWDRQAAQRADHLLAISKWSADRIEQDWGRTAQVIYPPVEVERFQPARIRDNFYLLVMRLVPYKMGLEIVTAFNQVKLPLVLVGSGPELKKIRAAAGATVHVLGHQPDSVITKLMNRAKAFVYMAAEDFGIVMVEAQAAGCPVIAYAKGGAAEIVINDQTGLFYNEQTAGALAEAVNQYETQPPAFDQRNLVQNAARFSRNNFRKNLSNYMQPFLDL